MKKLFLIVLLFACCSVRLSSADDESRTIRDENGEIIGRIDDTAHGKAVCDANGRIIGRIEDTANSRVIRDGNGKIHRANRFIYAAESVKPGQLGGKIFAVRSD